jgi:hypothetical protein
VLRTVEVLKLLSCGRWSVNVMSIVLYVLLISSRSLLMLVCYHYSETNMMHFLFNFLRIKGLHMFGHYLLILILCACYVSWLQPTDITCTQYTKCHLCSLILKNLNKKCIMLVAQYWYTWCRINKTLSLLVCFMWVYWVSGLWLSNDSDWLLAADLYEQFPFHPFIWERSRFSF